VFGAKISHGNAGHMTRNLTPLDAPEGEKACRLGQLQSSS